jgi:hypothetical protein
VNDNIQEMKERFGYKGVGLFQLGSFRRSALA